MSRWCRPSICLAVIVVGVLLRPIMSPSVWLDMSRGVAVLDGSIRPSKWSLIQETAADADWLAGVPFAATHALLGVHGLMLLKLVGGIVVAAMAWRLAEKRNVARDLCLIGLGLLSSLAAWDVTSQFWDVLGTTFLFWSLRKERATLWPGLLVLWIWSQLGTLVIIGLMIWGLAGQRSWREWIVAFLVCCATPRGALTLWDSLRLTCPRLASDGSTLAETDWRTLIQTTWEIHHVAFVVLTILATVPLCRRPGALLIVDSAVIAVCLGWMCQSHVGVAGVWLTLLLLRPQTEAQHRWSCATWRLVSLLLLIAAWWPWQGRRPGWGIDPRVDERLLAEAVSILPKEGSIWADDQLSAGMCLWVTNRRFQVHDEPRRALLGGRLREFVSLRRDLDEGRLSAYRRTDNSAGGWWLPLRERRTMLIVVSAERTDLLRSLEPTLWKPLSLDSPVLPFGQSGEQTVLPQIVNVLRQRDLVEENDWSPGLLGPSGTDRLWDVWGLAGISPNVEQELRQTRVFRAMQRPRAAQRILEPARRVSQSRALQLEAAHVQRDLSFDPVAQLRSDPSSVAVTPPEFSQCAACHAEQASAFTQTGHHNALRPLDGKVAQEFLGSATANSPVEATGVRLWLGSANGHFLAASSRMETGVPAQWLFGSGTHARTPVSVWLNSDGATECLEHRVSWYPHHGWGDTLGLTPSARTEKPPTGFPGKDRRRDLESLGTIHDPAATRDCFGCHTTRSPLANDVHQVAWQQLTPGVSCERCHPGGDQHARSAESGSPDIRPERWPSLTPLESVNRCGECHRRADHLTPDELTPDNQLLIRFASVGLVQSACFLKQSKLSADQLPQGTRPRFDCETCHDPHRPAESDSAFYVARCAACHNTAATKCSQQPADSNCLPCHMPKVEVQPPLRFTDHWIRIRKSILSQ